MWERRWVRCLVVTCVFFASVSIAASIFEAFELDKEEEQAREVAGAVALLEEIKDRYSMDIHNRNEYTNALKVVASPPGRRGGECGQLKLYAFAKQAAPQQGEPNWDFRGSFFFVLTGGR